MSAARVLTSRLLVLLVLSSLLAVSLVVTIASQARAATITVTTLADNLTDDGLCTLREAIVNANEDLATPTHVDCSAGTGVDTITFSVAGTITLGSALPGVTDTDALTIDGDNSITVSGNNLVRPLTTGGGSFSTLTGVLHLRNITVTNGRSQFGNGGAIFVTFCTTLTLTNSTVSNSSAEDEDGGGGAIYNAGATTVTNSTLSGNTAPGGGAIFNESFRAPGCPTPVVTVTDSTISGNTATTLLGGGGILNAGQALSGAFAFTITGSTITANHADAAVGQGGGIRNAGNMTISDSAVSNNTANGTNGVGGGIATSPYEFRMTGVTISGNATASTGGGLSGRNATITNSTISGNTAGTDGGGLNIDGTITNSTISGNTAVDGGGVASRELTLLNVTITDNSATGAGGAGGILAFLVFTGPSGVVTLENTIVADQRVGADCAEANATITSNGNNLDSDDTCELAAEGDIPGGNASLGPLAANGGLTRTHALLPASEAIDAGDNAACPATDQRGQPRRDGDGNGTVVCDIGAYEAPALPSASINDVTVIEGDSGTVDAVFTVILSHASNGTVTIAYATANGTATQPADYQPTSGTLTFTPGILAQTITVRVVGDTVDEPNETFAVNLSSPVNATLSDAAGAGTILDDEGPIVTPTPAPAAGSTSTPAAGQLPDTGTADASTRPTLAPWLALLVGAASASVLISMRRGPGRPSPKSRRRTPV